jgi:SAM-dependent methyltransferase
MSDRDRMSAMPIEAGRETVRILDRVRPQVIRQVPPYSALAAIYDGVMRHVNYRRWARYVREVASVYGVEAGRVLDIACGTGNFLEHFLGKAYLGYACDGSIDMIRRAKGKLLGKFPVRAIWVADMRSPGCRGLFDLVVCLYDSVNYLPDLSDYDQLLREVARILRAGGLFIFDVCTVENSVRNFNGYEDRERIGRSEFHRLSYFHADTGLQINEFLIGRKGELHREAFLEVHRQWIRPLELVRARVEASPLELLGQFEDFSFHPGTERSLRVHFVCRCP